MDTLTRRGLLGLAIVAPLGLIGTPALGADPAACFDPAAFSADDRSLRQSIGFTPKSGDPAKRCALCAFFKAGAGTCGTCVMLSGGAVASTSVCDSFAPKG